MTNKSSENSEALSHLNYIIGIHRSGSTLLTKILNGNSQIKAIPEIPLTIFFANRYSNIKGKNRNLENSCKYYLSIYQKIRPKDLVNLNVNKIDFDSFHYQSYHGFLSAVYENFTIDGNSKLTKLIIDKNPFYTFHYKRLQKLTPNPKFIVLVRDYRANILSRKSKSLNKPTNVAFNAFRWRIFHKKLTKFQDNGDCIITRYEDLVTNQVAELKRIYHFLNVNYESVDAGNSMVENVSTTIENEKTKEFINEHLQGLTKPVYQNRVEAWKLGLTLEEIELCEMICGNLGSIYGYGKTVQSKRRYVFLVCKNFKWYVKAIYSMYKEYPIYYLPLGIKLKRLQKNMGKLR
ncbi:MAG: sulfotransferase [Crocinitomicaceae bacterium]|jgi:hypothetical protein|nr:sulfotransferase [Crocinitomicaceae bacterium]